MNHSYSKFVRFMKFALPTGGVLILLLVIAWPFISFQEKGRLTNVDSSSTAVVENHMLKPTYRSVDKEGRPYEIEAEWGKPTTDHEADLTTPRGKLTTEEHGDVIVDAKKGHYDKNTRILNLSTDVVLNTEDGYHFETQKADVDLAAKTIEGDVFIKGDGPTGALQAQDGFKIEETKDGNRIITLKGHSQVVINSETLKKVNKQ